MFKVDDYAKSNQCAPSGAPKSMAADVSHLFVRKVEMTFFTFRGAKVREWTFCDPIKVETRDPRRANTEREAPFVIFTGTKKAAIGRPVFPLSTFHFPLYGSRIPHTPYNFLIWGVPEDSRPGDQDASSGACHLGGILRGHSAIELDGDWFARLVQHVGKVLELLDGGRDEVLSAEAGVHAHKQNEVEIVQDVAQPLNGCGRIEDDTGFGAFFPYESKGSLEVTWSFHVYADHVHPSVDKRFDKTVRILDHEMGVKGQVGAAAELSHNRGAESDVGDEMPIHDVKVDNVRPAPVHLGDFLAQAAKVGGKKRGSYLDRAIDH